MAESVYAKFGEEVREEGQFLKLKDGVKRKLKLIGIERKATNKPEFGDDEGMCIEFEFIDLEDGKQKMFYRKEMTGFGWQLKKAEVEVEDSVEITRTGEGKDTRYAMKKLGAAEAIAAKDEVDSKVIPF